MKKRLMIALAMGVLLAGMLPGVASAAFDEEKVIKDLQRESAKAAKDVEKTIRLIQKSRDSISTGDMFELQMLMDHLDQLSEMSDSIVSF